jgi:site-specific recombinase XerD
MKKQARPRFRRSRSLTLPELQHSKTAVLNTLGSLESKRAYEHAMNEFIAWYCSEPRLALNRVVVLRYRLYLESLLLAPATINVRLAAIRRLAYEAADNGLLSPELVAGIRRVRGVKQLGYRVGNWLSAEQSTELLTKTPVENLRGKRDSAILALLLGCGLRRSELAGLDLDQIQQRDQRWVIVDLIGKGGRIRTVPMPSWVKAFLDQWISSARITGGKLLRPIRKNGDNWGRKLTQNVIWYTVKLNANRAWIGKLAPHDLRRSCARLCHSAGGELEQIQFLLGHSSVQTTERYIGCKQSLSKAVNDRILLDWPARG